VGASDNGAAREARRKKLAARRKKRSAALKSLGNILIALSALGVLIVALLSVWDVHRSQPLAAAFTRVGGTTRVETALEAARFWLTPPRCVVMTPGSAPPGIMFAAAWYAMTHDAPLLYTTRDPSRQQLVNATAADWQKAAGKQKISETTFNPSGSTKGRCSAKADRADVDGLSTLAVPNQPLQLPHVAVRHALASMVVFAAAIEPNDPPDVAVGMALAAHMATPDRPVSLVIVPHYLESDPALESALESQRELVKGGVVLGETPTIPEATRVLLRELLTSTDQLSLLAQAQASLAAFGSFLTAFLAIFVAGAAARTTPWFEDQLTELGEQLAGPAKQIAEIIRQVSQGAWRRLQSAWRRVRNVWPRLRNAWPQPRGGRKFDMESSHGQPKGYPLAIAAPGDWLTLPDDIGDRTVTVWLRSGRKLSGTVEGQHNSGAGRRRDRARGSGMSSLRLNKAAFVCEDGEMGTDFVIVPVADIELIGIEVRKRAPRQEVAQVSG
jgi:hypothetical protein